MNTKIEQIKKKVSFDNKLAMFMIENGTQLDLVFLPVVIKNIESVVDPRICECLALGGTRIPRHIFSMNECRVTKKFKSNDDLDKKIRELASMYLIELQGRSVDDLDFKRQKRIVFKQIRATITETVRRTYLAYAFSEPTKFRQAIIEMVG